MGACLLGIGSEGKMELTILILDHLALHKAKFNVIIACPNRFL